MSFHGPLKLTDLNDPHYGHDLYEPVDHAHAWPDLRDHHLTEPERERLLKYASELLDAVYHFDDRINAEHTLLRTNKFSPEGEEPPHLPGLLTGLIFMPLRAAQRFLEARSDDETAVAYLRVADVLTRLLHTWRERDWEDRVDEFIARVGEYR